MRGPLATELARSVSRSAGRFLAIAGIAALGCGFFAGLNMTGSDMRSAADALYDGTALYDVRLVSTMGFGASQLDEVRAVEGVSAAMGSRSTDVMATLNDEQYAMRVMSLPAEAAASDVNDAGTDVTGSVGFLNRPILLSGSWPSEPDECVLSGDRVMGRRIEVGDTVSVLYGTSDLDGVLEQREFTVTGLVRSSSFVASVGLGYTNLGSGQIDQFMYVPESAFDADLPYTEIYVSVEGAADELSGSDAYQAVVDKTKARLEALAPALASGRLSGMRFEARERVAAAAEDLSRGRDEADGRLSAARAGLDDALERIEAAEAELTRGRSRLVAGETACASAAREAEGRLAAAAAAIDEGDAAVSAALSDLATAREELDDRRSELEAGKERLDGEAAAWEERRATLVGLADGYDEALSAVDAAEGRIREPHDEIARTTDADELARLEGLLAQAERALEEARASLDEAVTAIAGIGCEPGALRELISSGDDAIERAESELDYEGNREALDAADARLEALASELDARTARLSRARSEYRSARVRAASGLAASRAALDSAAGELASGEAELASGLASYESGLASYEASASEADQRLSDAAAQVEAAQAEVDELSEPDVYVLDRTKNAGAASYQSDSERIDSIARVFPLVFFLVAALVSLTTMTRMVEDERVEIGTHKALGFSTAQIAAKYVAYAALASGVGSVAGVLVLSQVLPYVIQTAYAIMYCVPIARLPLPVDPGVAALSLLLSVGVTLLATAAAVGATLRESPAALMLPRAPKPGKRILLERVAPVWSRLSFSWKVSLRNLFRYKRRLAMTVVGIAGCTALLLTGLGLHDSIWDIIDRQYLADNPVFSYSVVVGVSEGASRADLDAAWDALARYGDATTRALVERENMQAVPASGGADWAASVMVSDEPSSLLWCVALRDRASGDPIEFTGDSVVVTEKLASRLGVSVGDTIVLCEQDDVGNAVGDGYGLTVTGVCENYIAHYVYVGSDAWESVTGRACSPDTILTRVASDEGSRTALSDALHRIDGVSTVTFNTEAIGTYRKSLSSVNMIVVVLVAAAATLAFIVLYNLTNINVIERTREIASLKVLGFTPREVVAYVFRETVLLVVIGALLGLGLGVAMEYFVVLSSEVDAVMFGRDIHPASFAAAFACTLLFSLVVMAAMIPKLRSISMVESLKSVD